MWEQPHKKPQILYATSDRILKVEKMGFLIFPLLKKLSAQYRRFL